MPVPLIGVIAAAGGGTMVRQVAVGVAGDVIGGLVGGGDELGAPTVVVSIESEKTIEQFDALIGKLGRLREQMRETFLVWQAEDLNRKYPFVNQISDWTVETTIWPRSRFERRTGERKRRPRRVRLPLGGRSVPGGHRPILRPELYEQLRARMREMLHEPQSWQ